MKVTTSELEAAAAAQPPAPEPKRVYRQTNDEITAPFRERIESLELQLAALGGEWEQLPYLGLPTLREWQTGAGNGYRRELCFIHGEDTGSGSVTSWVGGFAKRVEEAFAHGVIEFPACEPGRVPKITFSLLMETVPEAEAVLSPTPAP
jgi:hypothetical protein